jgi:hypothetical protein
MTCGAISYALFGAPAPGAHLQILYGHHPNLDVLFS